MTDATLQDAIEDDYETELSRLGSSKALYALTGGEMETEAVLAGLADRAETAARTFDGWADDSAYGETFVAAAEDAHEHAGRIAESATDADPSDDPTPPDEVLRDFDDSDARLGGLLAWTMLTDARLSQAVGFFVGNADTRAADRFRDMRTDIDDQRTQVIELLADADGNTATESAATVVEAAYDHYAETLEGLGVKVKPVC